MKKLGLFKKFGLTAIVILLCLAMMITYFSFVMPSAGVLHAESSVTGREGEIASTKVEVLKGVNIKNSVKYGETITVPNAANATVTAPDGNTVDIQEGKVTALQIGNYKITYKDSNGEISYDYYVRVTLDEEYFLKVDFNGADIPTYVEKGKSIVLPEAQVVYYNEDNILTEYKGDYTVAVTNSRDNNSINVKKSDKVAAADRTYEVGATTGRQFLTYTAKIGGADGTKHFSQTFTTNVQSTVSRSGNPTLSVSGVQRDVSVNRAVTLPKATATDSYDDNIKIEIKVTYDGEPVKNVVLDENGFAVSETDEDVIFDNDQAMTFYPTKTEGSYKVEYTAYNDAWTEGGSVGKSSTREYWMKASDLAAPVFKDVDEHLIPETWGMTVYKSDGNGGEVEAKDAAGNNIGGKIKFTVPTVVDNKDHMYADPDKENDKDLISMYFRIYDSDNSKTVIEFTNILADDDDSASQYKSDSNSSYAADATFSTEDGFTFEFDKYRKKDADDNEVARTGTYTVLYRARDKANNTSSKTYTITLQDTYKDTAAPTTAEVTVPDYITSADETFTIPYAAYADASDSRPNVVYRVYTDATVANGESNYIDVDGGEEADIENGYLVINKDKTNEKKLAIGENLYFYVGVTDKVGNFKSNTENNVDLTATDDAEAYKTVDAKVNVISESAGFTFNGGSMTFVNANKDKTEIDAGDIVIASGFSIETADLDMRNYTGFEVAMYTPDGDVIPVTLETMSVPGDAKATIYVQNIRFHASVATEVDEDSSEEEKFYYMTVRVFDVNGNNEVYGYKFSGVKSNQDAIVRPSAVNTIGTTGDVNVTYKLHNDDPSIKGDKNDTIYWVRKIEGSTFALMGSEFTAKKQGSYTVWDGYIKQEKVSDGKFDYNDVEHTGLSDGSYSFTINDTAAPIFEVQGVMPTHWEKYKENGTEEEKAATTVKLPSVIAYTENSMATVTVEVTDKDGRPVDYDKDTNSFKGVKDGEHTVTYTAVAANGQKATAQYKISIGDVEGPEFRLINSSTATKKVGDTFTFAEMELLENENGVTVTKKLIDPSKEEVTDATVNGSYSNNADKKNNGTTITFSMAGTYEVVYTAEDSVGNTTTQRVTITVVSSGSSTPTTWTTLSTVLIIVAVVLLAGVIVYVVRFRKVKK